MDAQREPPIVNTFDHRRGPPHGTSEVSPMNRKWIEEVWAAGAAGERPDWADVEWYAQDADGRLAMFTSLGPGPIPRAVFRNLETHQQLTNYLHGLPRCCRAEFLIRYPLMTDYRNAAQRGLYAFNFEEDARRESGAYRLVARPDTPLAVSDFPPWVQEWLESLILKGINFAASEGGRLDLSRTKLEWV